MSKFIFSLVSFTLFAFIYLGVLNNTVQAGPALFCDGSGSQSSLCAGIECDVCCDGTNPCKGTRFDDVICGSSGVDVIEAGRGNDIICGFDGDDEIHAGAGCDLVEGGNGEDEVHGGTGCDDISGGGDNDELHGSSCADRIDGGGGGNDMCFGGAGIDSLSCEQEFPSKQNDQSDKTQCDCNNPSECVPD